MKLISVLTVSAVLLTLAACDGGGTRRTSGKQCPANYAPVSMKLAANQTQISLNPADKQLVPGIYSYEGTTAFYKDKSSPFVMEIVDAKEKNKQTYKAVPTCVRNSKSGMSLGFKFPVIRKLEVGVAPDFKTFYDTREISFTITNSLKVNSSDQQQKVEDVPSKAYEKVSNKGLMMVKKSDADFEIRSHFEDAQGEFLMVTRFKRANLPPAK